MKLRLTGTQEECEQFAAQLPELLDGAASVVELSGFYPNRGTSSLGRVYAELRLTPSGQAPAHAPRRGGRR